MSGGTTDGLSRFQALLLAALLDADGATVSYAELGYVLGSRGVNDRAVVWQGVRRLRRAGVGGLVFVRGRGLRLAALPPDWALGDVLAMLDEGRRLGLLGACSRRWQATA